MVQNQARYSQRILFLLYGLRGETGTRNRSWAYTLRPRSTHYYGDTVKDMNGYEIIDRVKPCDGDFSKRFVIQTALMKRWVTDENDTVIGFPTRTDAELWMAAQTHFREPYTPEHLAEWKTLVFDHHTMKDRFNKLMECGYLDISNTDLAQQILKMKFDVYKEQEAKAMKIIKNAQDDLAWVWNNTLRTHKEILGYKEIGVDQAENQKT